jgi:hypothetical protein
MAISNNIAYTLCIDIVWSRYQGSANFEIVSDSLHAQHLYRPKDSDNKNSHLYEQYKSDWTSLQQHDYPR